MAANLLLERDTFLRTLDELLGQVQGGQGWITLISGEAGIGKTSLVERFLDQQPEGIRVLWGACEALFTPRPLGPLYDLASQTHGPLRTLLEGESTTRATLFTAVQDELTEGGTQPTIMVIEDIHWADEATLDLIKFLARRIHRTRALLMLTYRDDELRKDHPLRFVLGDLPSRLVTRLHLLPLSEAGVAVLAQQAGRSSCSGELYAITSGNPFFLIETLASDGPGVASSVSDAVLARVARCSPEAQRLLELVSVVPSRTPGWMIEAVEGAAGSAQGTATLEECLARGLLRMDDGMVRYRHELARQAVEDALVPVRKRGLHAQVLHLLLTLGEVEQEGDSRQVLARLVHHAAQAEESRQVLRLAPIAARQAAAQRAHREAAAHYRSALEYGHLVSPEERADLLDGLAGECYLYGQMEEALRARSAALELWRGLNQTQKVGHTLWQLSSVLSFMERHEEAERCGVEAVVLLETVPPSLDLAMAYANLSGLHMVVSDTANTVLWGERALQLAEQVDDVETVCSALNHIGCAEMDEGRNSGKDKLARSLQLALEHGFEVGAARAYFNLSNIEIQQRDYVEAIPYLQDGLAYCIDHDMGAYEASMRANLAQVRLGQGDWIGAEEDVSAILSVPQTWCTRIPALQTLGLVRARRGDPGAEAALDEVQELALASGEMQYIAPMAAARAEWRWLQGDCEGCAAEAEVGYRLALGVDRPWHWGEAAVWLWRGGGLCEAPKRTPRVFSLQINGDWRGAASAWEQLDCPYERALALLDGDEAAQRSALDIFERLGARPAAELARRRLRGAGVRSLPRGPRLATQANPRGLTNRQLEILLLLAEGLHNAEIADRLSTTLKTVEHHVTAVLAKLEARSRAEAVRLAYEQRLIPTSQSGTAAAATFPVI
jgi:DNA-binding CsgD family transcriptional regulator